MYQKSLYHSNNNTIKRYFVEYLMVALIILSYLVSNYLGVLAAIIGFFYIITEKDNTNSICLFIFILPFSMVFNLLKGTTSLYMLLRIACVIKLLRDVKKINTTFILALALFVLYSTITVLIGISTGTVTNIVSISRILNFILWFLVAYYILINSNTDSACKSSRAISQGVLLSCLIAVNLKYIPNLNNAVSSIIYLNLDTGSKVTRFTALFNDPNLFTVILITSLFLIGLLFSNKKIRSLEFYVYSIALTVFGMMTLSKSCIILLVIFWIYQLLSKSGIRASHKIIIVFVGVFAFAILFTQMNDVIFEILYRFQDVDSASSLTSGRTDLWVIYLENMDIISWFIGKGVGADLPNGRAAHNTLIQIIYNVGIVGLIFWMMLFVMLYKEVKTKKSRRVFVPLVVAIVPMFFLDGLFIEMFYIVIPLIISFSFKECANTRFALPNNCKPPRFLNITN